MEIPQSWSAIDRLWARLIATWGRRFMDQYPGIEEDAVRAIWFRELQPFTRNRAGLEKIAWALDNLDGDPMNAVQFRKLCAQAPSKQEPLKLPPKADPERLKAELARLADAKASIRRVGIPDGKEWVQTLIERAERGERLSSGQRLMLKNALGDES